MRAVGLEPTLLAELDFESSASTSFTTPAGEGDPFIKPPPRTPEGEAPMTGESQNGDIPGRDLAVSEAAAARSGRSHRVSPTGPLIRRDKRRSIVRDNAYVASVALCVNVQARDVRHSLDSFAGRLGSSRPVPATIGEMNRNIA